MKKLIMTYLLVLCLGSGNVSLAQPAVELDIDGNIEAGFEQSAPIKPKGNSAVDINDLPTLKIEKVPVEPQPTKITWLGHAAFKIVTPTGKVLMIDPWLLNPKNPEGQDQLDSLTYGEVDLVLVTHGHFDHVGEAVAIGKKTGAKLVATYDLGNALVTYGGYPKSQTGYDTFGNFGGQLSFFEDEVKVTFIPAIHSSSFSHMVKKEMPVAEAEENTEEIEVVEPEVQRDVLEEHLEYAGNPGGFLVEIKEGPAIYHTGDTDVFGDMDLLKNQVDVMLTCIGDHFTMGPYRAAKAVSLVRPDMVIPMHYGTFPSVLTGTADDFKHELFVRDTHDKLKIIQSGETFEYK